MPITRSDDAVTVGDAPGDRDKSIFVSEVRATLAVVLEQFGEPAQAMAMGDESLRLFPDDAPTLYNRAAALMALSRRDEARAVLLALAPRFPPAADALKRHGP